jgi:predicted acetyltransferase
VEGDSLVGFALVGSAAEWLGDIGAHDVHEFFIIRGFRRSGFGERLAAFIWDEHPGEWLVRVLEANAAAVLFWRSLVANYANGLYLEEERISKSRPWRFFRFATKTR